MELHAGSCGLGEAPWIIIVIVRVWVKTSMGFGVIIRVMVLVRIVTATIFVELVDMTVQSAECE